MSLRFATAQCWSWLQAGLGRLSGLPLARPSRFTLVLTDRCNLQCMFCSMWNRRWENMSTDLWKRILDELVDWVGPMHVVFTGGEPLVRDDLPELVRHASSRGACCEINSNGISLDERAAGALVQSGLRVANVSVLGLTSETSERLYGRRDVPERVRRALLSLKAAGGHGLRIQMLTTLLAQNLHEVGGILDLAEELNLEGVQFQPIYQHFGDNHEGVAWFQGNPLWPRVSDATVCLDLIIERKKRGGRVVNPLEQLELFRGYLADPTHCRKPCVAADASLVLECDGSVYACVFKPAGPLGNVQQMALRKLWTQPAARRIRDGIRGCRAGCAVMNMNYRTSLSVKLGKYMRIYHGANSRTRG